ncbi:MAG: hypothetical protein OEW15_01755 [Nitrospirota bacterium]|nr:hypothetical protein [Nitrospirota bacterium]
MRKTLRTPPVGMGDIITVPHGTEKYQIQSVEPALKKRSLRNEGAAVFDYEPGLMLLDPQGRTYRVGAFPPSPVGSTYMHVLTFGIGPGVELKKGREVVFRGYIALQLTPFGNVDVFDNSDLPYKFYLSIIPNSTIRKGKESANTYDLEKPRYNVTVVKEEQTILNGETDSSIRIDENLTLSFFTPSDWVIVEVVQDRFLPWFVLSICLICVGIVPFLFSMVMSKLRAK